ncbi:nucleotidyl transferase AbiEii/AbiGii toxin family protein [Candidatus Peregrinibacteria bacterium]|nr:nucleotidyl transferase AbiEii/AbiGii toxin family protein [Candidatus Peregrinibacteria bacterium]
MITRQQLEIINRRTLKYPLAIAEKDYFLALALNIMARSPLGSTLVFKGGTAIHHCYLDQYRFSEDLDFSANQRPVTLKAIGDVFKSTDYLSIKKDHISGATVKIEKLQYSGPLIQLNSLKVEIDFLQNVLLPPQIMPYKNVWGIESMVRVMDVREIVAEKIRAMSDRARYRDFYDLFLILEKYPLNLLEIIGYMRQKEIRKPITKENIKNNWMVVGTQKATEMMQIYYSREVQDEQIEIMIENLPFINLKTTASGGSDKPRRS